MKLKLIAAAVVMVVAGSANAALIDNGSLSATGYNGNLVFSIWDTTVATPLAPTYSYSLNLGSTLSSFASWAANPTSPLTWAPDALLTSFLSTANTAALQWNIVATGGSAGNTLLSTFSQLPTSPVDGPSGISAVSNTRVFINNLNTSGTYDPALGNTNSSKFDYNSAAFPTNNIGDLSSIIGNSFSSAGDMTNNSFATGLGIVKLVGNAKSTAFTTQSFYPTSGAVVAYFDASKGLTIAAVPEPETFAMLLAGLGVMGLVARRRRQSTAA